MCTDTDDQKKEINTILLPVKLSTGGINAFQMAQALAECSSARLEILYVLKPGAEVAASAGPIGAELESTQDRLESFCKPRLKRIEDVHFTCRAGDPAREIVSRALECRADLIVLGCHFRDDQPCYNRM